MFKCLKNRLLTFILGFYYDTTPPLVGSIYTSRPSKNPFEKKHKVLVKDVKGKYVNLSMCPDLGTNIFNNVSLEVDVFNGIYEIEAQKKSWAVQAYNK